MEIQQLAAKWVVLLLCVAGALKSEGVILISTGDPSQNTTPPAGTLAGSGWDWQGQWNGFWGTPIASSYFITAEHIGGAVSDTFLFGAIPYVTTAVFDHPNTDLRIWQVNGTFSSFAPLYLGSDEIGKSLVVFGRGTQRESEVRVEGVLKGWTWGASDSVQRWGENQVAAVVYGGGGVSDLLQATFSQAAGPNEAHLSVGDSGGGVFVQENGSWKLAGVNYAVDSQFNYTGTDGQGFDAALFDMGGLYLGRDGA